MELGILKSSNMEAETGSTWFYGSLGGKLMECGKYADVPYYILVSIKLMKNLFYSCQWISN